MVNAIECLSEHSLFCTCFTVWFSDDEPFSWKKHFTPLMDLERHLCPLARQLGEDSNQSSKRIACCSWFDYGLGMTDSILQTLIGTVSGFLFKLF